MKQFARLGTLIFTGIAGAGFALAQIAAKYGVAIPAPMYGPAIVKPNVTVTGMVANTDGAAIAGVTVRVIDGLMTTTDEKGNYSLGIYMAEGQTTQLVVVDPDGKNNGGDFASAVVDVNLNTNDESTANDAKQTINFKLKAKK